MKAPRAIALCQCFNGALEFRAGHWPEAEAALHESIRLYREIGAASGEALAWQRLGELQTARGQLSNAMTSFEEGVVVAERAVMRAHCLARLYASMTRNRLMDGDLEAADHYLELGLVMGERHGNCTTCDALLWPVAVSVRVAEHNFAAAEEFSLKLFEAAKEYASRTWVALAYQSQAELAAAQGDLDRALSCYISAYKSFLSTGNRYETARCLEALASVRRRRSAPDDHEEARIAQLEAEYLFEQLEAA
jgi:tetratricopeptide (TPR) repeat protein